MAQNKRERFDQIEEILLSTTRPMTRAEIARRLGVYRSTVCRDAAELTRLIPLQETDQGLLWLDKTRILRNVRLSLFEMESLHLSARLFARVMQFPFPHASSALRKLAEAQEQVSPPLAGWMQETADELDQTVIRSGAHPRAREKAHYRRVIEEIGCTVTEGADLFISYYSHTRNREKPYQVQPLTLEPHPEGRSVYLLARMLDTGEQRTFKTERIRRISRKIPEPPRQIDEADRRHIRLRLQNAWSIWAGEADPITVRLRFTPAAASSGKPA